MSEKKLTVDQERKIKEIKQQWIEEAEACFKEREQTQEGKCQLDGNSTWKLVKLQEKYDKQMREIINKRDCRE